MKITKEQLKQIIKEELKEGGYAGHYIRDEENQSAKYRELIAGLDMELASIRNAIEDIPKPNENDRKTLERVNSLQGFLSGLSKSRQAPDEIAFALNEDGHIDVPSARRKLKTSIEDAMEILQGLEKTQDEDELPSWWMDKITLAANYLNKARDYILIDGD